jgi:hypothetical protein
LAPIKSGVRSGDCGDQPHSRASRTPETEIFPMDQRLGAKTKIDMRAKTPRRRSGNR